MTSDNQLVARLVPEKSPQLGLSIIKKGLGAVIKPTVDTGTINSRIVIIELEQIEV